MYPPHKRIGESMLNTLFGAQWWMGTAVSNPYNFVGSSVRKYSSLSFRCYFVKKGKDSNASDSPHINIPI